MECLNQTVRKEGGGSTLGQQERIESDRQEGFCNCKLENNTPQLLHRYGDSMIWKLQDTKIQELKKFKDSQTQKFKNLKIQRLTNLKIQRFANSKI